MSTALEGKKVPNVTFRTREEHQWVEYLQALKAEAHSCRLDICVTSHSPLTKIQENYTTKQKLLLSKKDGDWIQVLKLETLQIFVLVQQFDRLSNLYLGNKIRTNREVRRNHCL